MAHHTGTLQWQSAALILLALTLPGTAFAACKLSGIADLPVTMVNMRPLLAAKINGIEALFLADSGAFVSGISPAMAAQFKLKTYAAPPSLGVEGVNGQVAISVAKVRDFTLAGVPIPDAEFVVGGGETGAGSAGILGQNVLRVGDVEYDLAKGAIRLVREYDCSKANLAYWTAGTDIPYSVIDIEWPTPLTPHTIGTAYINGVRMRALFDTGSPSSVVSLRAAERAGIRVDGPGTSFLGFSGGAGREMNKTWVAPVASFKIGDEEIHNTHLRIIESLGDAADMLLGVDFFLSHRIYVASKQQKLYFTYNGGPVFNLTNPKSMSAKPVDGASAAGATSSGSGEPKDAAEFSRRGTAFAARKDFVQALADLSRACELAPDEPNYFYERGLVYRDGNDTRLALADFDRALQLKPDHVPALVARAELRRGTGDVPHAIEDLNAADAAASREADVRFRMSSEYTSVGLLPAAMTQLDLWIATHDADYRMVQALQDRCWLRALQGQDLPKALDDCNDALRRANRNELNSARSFSGRGLVRWRMGDYDKSIADYDASLKLAPKDPWALYGRGIAKMRRGRSAEGQSDIAAASAQWQPIADRFRAYGILPE